MKVLLSIFFLSLMQQSHALVTFSKDTVLMGVSFNFTAVHEDNTVAENAVSAGIKEVVRIEALISSWDINSQTSQINQQAGIAPVKVDEELFFLIKRAKKVSELTNGLFDISFASIDKVWDFENFDQNRIPDESVLKALIKYIDYKKIILNETDRSVFLAEPGMKIGFGAIGKGYAANKVKQLLLDLEIENGVVNAGGDLLCWGKKANNKEWSIGIADPKDKNKVLSWINTSDMAVVTSGNYEKYFTINGEKYCHIINPTTGWPVKHLASVTIVCPDAEIADALATSVFILGRERGIALIDKLEGVECVVVDTNNEMFISNNMNQNFVEVK